MKIERRKTDVLCVGGGVAGLMAAVGARKEGAEVIVVEKGNAAHSGAGRIGCDHFGGYFPDVHGPDMEDPVVIWQGGIACAPIHVGANARIEIVDPLYRVKLIPR